MNHPFSPSANTSANDSSTPFGDDDDDAIEIAPAPVGVLRGKIEGVKKILDKGTGKVKAYAVEIKCIDPAYTLSETVSIWVPLEESGKLKQLAGALGIACETQGTRVVFINQNGVRGLNAFTDAYAHFIFVPYNSAAALARFGAPKAGFSAEWDQYMDEAQFDDKQLKAIKRAACGCVIPNDAADLFD